MRRITALWESFFSKNLYSDAFYSWKGIGFLTLLLLVAIHTVIIFGKMSLFISAFIHHGAPPIVKQIPAVTFQDGKASTPEPIAYEIKDPDSGQLIAIINTTISQPPADLGGAIIYIAGEKLTAKKSEVEQRSYDYKAMENTTIDETKINSWLTMFGDWAGIICAPFIFVFLVIWRLVQLIIFSIVTLIMCNVRGLNGSYAAQLRITAMAMVPGLVLGLIWSALSIDFFGISLLFCAITIAYIFFGVTSARSDAEEEAPPVIPQ